MQPHECPAQPPRRSFLKEALAMTAGGLVSMVPAAAGLVVVLDPVLKKYRKEAGQEGLIPITNLSAVPPDGTARIFQVVADKSDAWNFYPQVPVGSVYLVQSPEKKLTAFNAACPHAGCYFQTKPDGSFRCPCHESEFNADGTIRPIGSTGKRTVSPRGLDKLEVSLAQDGKTVLVKFQNFLAGQEEQIPL